MKTWTIDEMMAERPCGWRGNGYNRTRIAELWAGRAELSLLDITEQDIPPADKIWVACRMGALTKRQRSVWLERTVTRAITNHALSCGVKAVETWAGKWLSGENRNHGTAREAAWAAAAAAEAAAAARAEAAERNLQVADLRAVLGGES